MSVQEKEVSVEELPEIDLIEAIKEAYEMGYQEFSDMDLDEPEMMDLSKFKEMARFTESIAPELRRIAGNDDRGLGTYKRSRQVVLRNLPKTSILSSGDTLESSAVEKQIFKAWDKGARDAALGNEKYNLLEIDDL